MFPEKHIEDIRWAERSDKINSIARLEMLVVTYTPFVPPKELQKYPYGGNIRHERWVAIPSVLLSAEEWDREEI